MSKGKWTNYRIFQDSLKSYVLQKHLQCFMKDFSIYNSIPTLPPLSAVVSQQHANLHLLEGKTFQLFSLPRGQDLTEAPQADIMFHCWM